MSWILKLVGFVRSYSKIASIVSAIAAFAAFVTWGYNVAYNNGYDSAEHKWEQAQAEAILAAVDAAKEQWEAASATAEENVRIETEIVERVRVVEREVPVVVERTVPAECRDLGPDVQRLFNDAIRAASASEAGNP